ncbi:MAG: hypothetical protein CMI95_01720 [Pelagibacteraceae bacterium]|nr:hypothetical protein [Pelagibacteraceae bacterium]PPR51262.1 MAG: hypothetical protein CFH20_00688 [Alphaproteobacteria bacterium MarineAlpha5_Bin10]|tara:strand:+ start:4858 stop:6087 length:1230 start_codon:yes stop_codon:yes gene_type:complete
MNNQTEQKKEIDIFTLAEIIWKGKVFIVSISVFLFVVGYAYSHYRNSIYEGSAKFYALIDHQLAPLSLLIENVYQLSKKQKQIITNKTIGIDSNIILESRGADGSIFSNMFTPMSFFDIFYQTIKSKDLITKINYNDILEKIDNNFTEEDYAILLNNFSGGFDINIKDNPGIETGGREMTIYVQNSNKNILEKYLDTVIQIALFQTKQQILNNINSALENYKLASKLEIRKLREQNLQLQAMYEVRTEDRITQLKEQAEIARIIGIKTPLNLNIQSITTATLQNSAGSQIFKSQIPFYYRGYLALEKEIENLKSRTNIDVFIPELRNNEETILILQRDTLPYEISENIKQSGIDDNSFNPVYYEKSSISISEKTWGSLRLALSGLAIGLLLSLVIHIFRTLYILEKRKI